jgi:hypothetical protein
MKTFNKFFGLAIILMLTTISCEKDDTFCIEDILQTGTLTLGQVTISPPGEQAYTGVGVVPSAFKIGKYEGKMSSVVIRQIPTEGGAAMVQLRHHFDDGKGNKFWTHDHATFTPVNGSQTVFNVYDEMAIWVGEGDFKNSDGMLINTGVVDFATNKLDFKCVGSICGMK